MTPYEKAVSEALKKEGGQKPVKESSSTLRASGKAESDLEAMFDTLLDQIAPELPKPMGYRGSKQHQPLPNRLYKVDRYFDTPGATTGVIVECEGIGHNQINWQARKSGERDGKGYDKDIVKYNMLSSAGFVVLRVTKFYLETYPDEFFNTLRLALRNAGIVDNPQKEEP